MPPIRGNRLKENFMYLTTIVNREVKKALRQVFIQAWDRCHPLTPWDDTGWMGGFRLYSMESWRPAAKPYLSSYLNGDTETWDCSALIDAILFSNAIGKSRLHVQVANAVNDLRDIRNKIMHNKSDEISDDQFTALIKRIKNDFSILGVSKKNIDEISEEKSMYTSFIKVPPSSPESHEQERLRQNRIDIAFEIVLQISQRWTLVLLNLARNDLEPFGYKWLKREQKKSIQNRFVMTLDGRNEESILKSYKDFSSQVDCDDDITSEIMESGLTKERKIMELKSQVQSKVKNWNSWLIMVTDVEDLEKTMHFLPQRIEGWENGLILVSTSEFCFGYYT